MKLSSHAIGRIRNRLASIVTMEEVVLSLRDSYPVGEHWVLVKSLPNPITLPDYSSSGSPVHGQDVVAVIIVGIPEKVYYEHPVRYQNEVETVMLVNRGKTRNPRIHYHY